MMKIPRIKEVISQQEIATRIKTLGAQISHDYVDKQLVVLAILNGAFYICRRSSARNPSASRNRFLSAGSLRGMRENLWEG